MSEHLTKSVAQKQPEQKIEKRIFVSVTSFAMVATAVAVLAVPIAKAFYAQDKYSLKSPSGIAFSDFRGYEDWAIVSTAKTDVLKAIVANPAMIKAYKAGVPGGGQTFPEGSKIVKIQWKTKKSTEAPSSWMCRTHLPRSSSWKKTARPFRKTEEGGDTLCSTTTLYLTSSHPIPKVSQTAETRAIRQ